MPYYQAQGRFPQKRFTVMRRPDGGVYYEQIITAEGFGSEASVLYRLGAPIRVLSSDTYAVGEHPAPQADAACNQLFQVANVGSQGDYLAARRAMITSPEITFSLARPDRAMTDFYRNAWADELVAVVQGSGTLRSAFGEIRYEELDLVYVPRGDTVQWIPDPGPQVFAISESRTALTAPPQHVKPNGQFREHAPYHERDIRPPKLAEPIDEHGEFTIHIKTGGHMTRAVIDHHPFDVVGWDGCFYPYALSMRDLEPLSGRVHLLPDQYAVLANEQTMISCITPRRLADHPDSTPLQPYHINTDYDEILYRFGGSTGATEPQAGTFTLHPRGLDHGPKPGFETMGRRESQDAWGLMIDTRAHLQPTAAAMQAADQGYKDTWITNQLAGPASVG